MYWVGIQCIRWRLSMNGDDYECKGVRERRDGGKEGGLSSAIIQLSSARRPTPTDLDKRGVRRCG